MTSANPAALSLQNPLDVSDARVAARRLSERRRNAEEDLERAVVEAAEAERDYRRRFAIEFVKAASEEGTAGQKEAIAKSEAADSAFERDVKERMVRVYQERLRGLEGDRSMLKSLVDWSSRLNLDGREHYGRGQG